MHVGKNISFEVGQLRSVKRFMDDNGVESWSTAIAILVKRGLVSFGYSGNKGVGVGQERLPRVSVKRLVGLDLFKDVKQ